MNIFTVHVERRTLRFRRLKPLTTLGVWRMLQWMVSELYGVHVALWTPFVHCPQLRSRWTCTRSFPMLHLVHHPCPFLSGFHHAAFDSLANIPGSGRRTEHVASWTPCCTLYVFVLSCGKVLYSGICCWPNRGQLFSPDGLFWHRPPTTSTNEEHHPKEADKEKAAMLAAAW